MNGSSVKSETRKRVSELRSANLSMKMSQIAKNVGISRQRVYRILKTEGLPTKPIVKKYEHQCYKCCVCGTLSTSEFCSNECKQTWTRIPVVCSGCGKLFFRSRHQFMANYRHHNIALFCSPLCTGRWIQEQWGFNRYPEHAGRNRKYDWDEVWKSHLETGYGGRRLSKKLNIPLGTIASILRNYRQNTRIYQPEAPICGTNCDIRDCTGHPAAKSCRTGQFETSQA
jgi:hypothetical protein